MIDELLIVNLRDRCTRLFINPQAAAYLTSLAAKAFESDFHQSNPIKSERDAAAWASVFYSSNVKPDTLNERSVFGMKPSVEHAGTINELVTQLRLNAEGEGFIEQLRTQLLEHIQNWEGAFSIVAETPLTENDRSILSAMLDLNATSLNPEPARVIIPLALYLGDAKRAFDNLIGNGFVASKCGRSGGYWLTKRGIEVAKELANNGATVRPTVCND